MNTIASSVRIPNLTNPLMIEAFFGTANSYNYTVTPEDFDEFDNEGPGQYRGVSVSPDQADAWDDGIRACKQLGIELRSLDGLRLRLNKFGRADRAESLHARLESERRAPMVASWRAETSGCDLIPITKIPGWVVVVRQDASPEYRAYAIAAAARAEDRNGWAWIWREDQYDAAMMSAIRGLWAKSAPGWLHERDGSPVGDDQVKAIHSHSGIALHLGGEKVSKWPKAPCYRGRVVVARPPAEVEL